LGLRQAFPDTFEISSEGGLEVFQWGAADMIPENEKE
jgi:hypothetical protein